MSNIDKDTGRWKWILSIKVSERMSELGMERNQAEKDSLNITVVRDNLLLTTDWKLRLRLKWILQSFVKEN